jgi:V/A-type H+-transporting ATPase subunit I
MQAKKGNLKDAVFSEGAQWIILLGALVYGVKMLGVNIPNMVPLVIMAVGVVLLLYGSTRNAKGFSKITAPIGEIYNQATGWFGDILSYSRIMALMLAGSVIGQVFNNLATMPLKGAKGPVGTVIGVIAALLIFVVGHALNFGLNILGCFVHDLRLQCLEFFGKFYQDGGKRFEPLAFRTKYYNVAQQ